MVKGQSDRERGNPLPTHRLLFLINSKGSFICTRWNEKLLNGSDNPSHHKLTLYHGITFQTDKRERKGGTSG